MVKSIEKCSNQWWIEMKFSFPINIASKRKFFQSQKWTEYSVNSYVAWLWKVAMKTGRSATQIKRSHWPLAWGKLYQLLISALEIYFFLEIIVFSGTSTNCSHHSKTRAKQVVNNRDAPYSEKAKVSIQFGFRFCFWLNNIPYEFLVNWLRDFYRRRKTARSILAVDNKCIVF